LGLIESVSGTVVFELLTELRIPSILMFKHQIQTVNA